MPEVQSWSGPRLLLGFSQAVVPLVFCRALFKHGRRRCKGGAAAPKKERMELAEASFYSDKLDMLVAATTWSLAS